MQQTCRPSASMDRKVLGGEGMLLVRPRARWSLEVGAMQSDWCAVLHLTCMGTNHQAQQDPRRTAR
jgi:hypothetical protein